MPSLFEETPEEAAKWKEVVAAEQPLKAAVEAAHAVMAFRLGFRPPGSLYLSIDDSIPGYTSWRAPHGYGGWHHVVKWWFDIEYASYPTAPRRIAALEAQVVVSQAGPLMEMLRAPENSWALTRDVVGGLDIFFTEECGWENSHDAIAMLALGEKFGLLGKPSSRSDLEGVDPIEADEAWCNEVVDDYFRILEQTRSMLAEPDVARVHEQVTGELLAKKSMEFERVYEIGFPLSWSVKAWFDRSA